MSSTTIELRCSTRPRWPNPAYAIADPDVDVGLDRCKRRRKSAGTRKSGAAKGKRKPKDHVVVEGGVIDDDDDVCTEESDAEAMQLAEEEEAALEEEAKAAAGAAAPEITRKWRAVLWPRRAAPVHRKAGGPSDSEVCFVGDKIPDDEAR
jgi:hypothetical protein